ncbi:hypothetical protein VIBC2010_04222 [Vibrio caribbeanicus ATCC BAA-2122]|uniref:Uncharacterized protein n=1 Tax=Vibrio caribbeanicus ATCC BAA-2122 TaxID=796620 RepID=E3BPJ8_9VIBR|nr:hypothetical protein VIBC2010_04222 [Vibrio caribbeanicus ATCC BAA-2122]
MDFLLKLMISINKKLKLIRILFDGKVKKHLGKRINCQRGIFFIFIMIILLLIFIISIGVDL